MSTQINPVATDAQRMMMYDANKKSTGVAYALWFFLGWAGGHRFYLNRSGTGAVFLVWSILSLVLSIVGIGLIGGFLLGIWWLVDAFLISDWLRVHNNRLATGLSQ